MNPEVTKFLERNGQCYIAVNQKIKPQELEEYGDNVMRIAVSCGKRNKPSLIVFYYGKSSTLFNEAGFLKKFGTLDLNKIEHHYWIIPFTREDLRKNNSERREKGKIKNAKRKQKEIAAKSQEQWENDTRNKLLKEATKSERFLYSNMPVEIKCLCEKQHKVKVDNKLYYIDLFIRKYNIAIEVDGDYHSSNEQKEKDKERDENLRSVGIITKRIKNEDVWSAEDRLEFWCRIFRIIERKKRNNHAKGK